MFLNNLMLHAIDWEHRINQVVLGSKRLPGSVKFLYGQLRNRLGRRVYRLRFCPVRSSPTSIIASVLRRGDVYLDIGANEGQMASIASVSVGNSGRIYAFEPRETAFRHLQQLCITYKLTNILPFQFLLGDYNGEREFFENSDHPSSSSLCREWARGNSRTYPMLTLDKWAEQNSVQKADLIKIDVEGAEMQVLQGGLEFLRQTQPLLIMEIRDSDVRKRNFGYDVSDLIKLLRGIGYMEFFSLRRRGLVRIQSATDILPNDDDILALNPVRLLQTKVVKSLEDTQSTP